MNGGALPPGFVLDQPPAAQAQPGLPPGFTLDGPEPSKGEKAAKVLANIAKFTPGGAAQEIAKKVIEGLDKAAYEGGGLVTDVTGSPAAGTAANVVLQSVPTAVGGVAGLIAKAPLRAGAERLMQQALKPSVKALKNEGATGVSAERAITTMLDEGVSVSRGGVEKLQGKIDALSSQVAEAIKNSGATVDRNAIASRLQDVIDKIERTSLNPQDRVAAVEKVWDQVLTNQALPRQIPVQQANEIKSGIYKVLKEKYGEWGSDAVEAQKALARGAKEEISAAVPGIAELNKKEAELINALQLAQHRALVTGNKDIGGLAWLTTNPKQFAAFMADRSPLFKSIVARMINQASENAPLLGAAAGVAYPQDKGGK